MLEQRIMGCGQSKPRSRSESSIDDMETDKKFRKNKNIKNDKNNKVSDKKVNQDVSKSGATKVSKRKDSGVVKSNIVKEAHTINTNGIQKIVHSEFHLTVNQDKIEGKFSKYENNISADGTRSKIRVTNSQIEFFKMLDEKIEQGKDYLSEDDFSQRSDMDDQSLSDQ